MIKTADALISDICSAMGQTLVVGAPGIAETARGALVRSFRVKIAPLLTNWLEAKKDSLFKVIGHSNFDLENVSDILVVDGLSEAAAKEVTISLNSKANGHSTWYYKTVPNDHKLYRFEP